MPRISRVWVSDAVRDEFVVEAERAGDYETGGILIGYWTPDGSQAVVTQIIGPGPGALHTRTKFVPDTEYQEVEITRIYLESGRIQTYLGDWHTHPEGRLFQVGPISAR